MWPSPWSFQGIGSTPIVSGNLIQSTFGSQVVLGSDTFYHTDIYDNDTAQPRYLFHGYIIAVFTTHPFRSIFLDTLFIPVYAVTFSVLAAAVHFLATFYKSHSTSGKQTHATGGDVPHANEPLPQADVSHVQQHGGVVIFLYRVVRLLACLALVGISIFSTLHNSQSERLSRSVALHLALCGVYVRVLSF